MNDLETQKKWLETFSKVYGVRPCAFERGGTYIAFALVKSRLFGSKLASLPYITYGGFINPDNENNKKLLCKCVERAEVLGIRHIEIHGLESLNLTNDERQTTNDDTMRGWHIHEIKNKVTFWLKLLPTVDEQWKALDAKVRNQIRKAEKNGLSCSVEDIKGLNNFYKIHSKNMKDLGSPVHSKNFFEAMFKQFGERCRIFNIKKGGKTIASSIAFKHGTETLEVPWAGTLKEYNKLCHNMLLYWSMLQYAIENQFEFFDFGRCTINSGTYRFKKQWDAEEKPIYWYELSKAKPKEDANLKERFSTQQRIWSKLPFCIANWIGPWIRKQITL